MDIYVNGELIHSNSGWVKKDHKYISKEYKNGNWVYKYDVAVPTKAESKALQGHPFARKMLVKNKLSKSQMALNPAYRIANTKQNWRDLTKEEKEIIENTKYSYMYPMNSIDGPGPKKFSNDSYLEYKHKKAEAPNKKSMTTRIKESWTKDAEKHRDTPGYYKNKALRDPLAAATDYLMDKAVLRLSGKKNKGYRSGKF